MKHYTQSIAAYNEALKHIPGGVNSPARSFKSVGGDPLFISSAKGSKVFDIDEHEYIDYVGSWGPMILGHTHPDVVMAIQKTAARGTSFGAPTLAETDMARQIKKMVPSIESIRMVNSGTEATMSALRLARGYTGRDLVIKFEGCYHGHNDSFLIKAGSGALTLGTPDSPGVTAGTAKDTLIAAYNDLASVQEFFAANAGKIAAVIVEPVAGNMGLVLPEPGFLQGLRDLCTQHGSVLIFDEVMTGFRLSKGGAQQLFGITPDLTTFGKIIGGGLPVGAYGGKQEIMDMLAPKGPVYQAGTLSGNPLAMAAGLTTLKLLDENDVFYTMLEDKSVRLEEGMRKCLTDLQYPAVINRVGSMFTVFFTEAEKVSSYADACKCNTENYAKFFKVALEKGVYFAPSQFETSFMSAAHTAKVIDKTIEVFYVAIKSLQGL